MLPEGLEERFRELRRAKGLREDREAAVERWVFGTGPELWVPQVPLPPARNQPPPRLVDEPVRRGAEAGLDASGRPVLVRDAHGFRAWLLVWDGPRLEVVECDSHGGVSRVTWVDHDESGRPAQFATASTAYTELGEAAEIARCEWDGDRCARARWHVNNDGRAWHEGIVEAEYDERGLVRVLEDSIATWQREFDAFEEDPLAPDEALEAWGEAVAAAAARVVEDAGVADAAFIKVIPVFRGDAPSLVIVDRTYLAAAHAREAIRQCSEPRHWFMREVDASGLRALRSLRQQRVADDEQPAAAEALMRRLAAMSWPGGAIPLVAGFTRDM